MKTTVIKQLAKEPFSSKDGRSFTKIKIKGEDGNYYTCLQNKTNEAWSVGDVIDVTDTIVDKYNKNKAIDVYTWVSKPKSNNNYSNNNNNEIIEKLDLIIKHLGINVNQKDENELLF